MTNPRAQQVPVADDEPLLGDERSDYADAFEIRTHGPDPRSPEEVMRAALEESRWFVRQTIWLVHRHVLRFRLAPRTSPAHVLGWTIMTSEPDVAHLRAESPLLRADLVLRRLDGDRARITTYAFYRRPAACRALWAVIGPLHRAIAPYLMERTAAGRPHADAHVSFSG